MDHGGRGSHVGTVSREAAASGSAHSGQVHPVGQVVEAGLPALGTADGFHAIAYLSGTRKVFRRSTAISPSLVHREAWSANLRTGEAVGRVTGKARGTASLMSPHCLSLP